MLRKTLISMLAIIMAMSVVACGSSKEQEVSKTKDVQNENVQNENIQNEAMPADAAPEQDMAEADTTDEIPHFEATDEIKNASMYQFKIQVADMIFESFYRVSDYMEKIENSALPFTHNYNPDKLITITQPGYETEKIEIYLNGELYMRLIAGNPDKSKDDKETRPLKDCMVCNIKFYDNSNVYFAGGIPALDSGMSIAEFDSIMQEGYTAPFGDDMTYRVENTQENSFVITYGSNNCNHFLECDGAIRSAGDYKYVAYFDETGTNLKLLKLDGGYAMAGLYRWSDNIKDSNIIIER